MVAIDYVVNVPKQSILYESDIESEKTKIEINNWRVKMVECSK